MAPHHAPDWSALPTELLLEVAKLLLPSHLGPFALVSRAWRHAILPLVTILHLPFVSDITLPSGPVGSQQIEVVERYLESIKQQQQCQRQNQEEITAKRYQRSGATRLGRQHDTSANSDANATQFGDTATTEAGNWIATTTTATVGNGSSGPTGDGAGAGRGLSLTGQLLTGIATGTGPGLGAMFSPPLLQRLLQRFPYARTVGLHRSQLRHPRLEVAALQGLSACQPPVVKLHVYDTLAWDFPQQLTNLAGLTQLVSLKLWNLGAPGLDPSAQWAFSRGLVALSNLTRLQELTLRWLFGRQEVVWTCPHTPRLVRALTDGGARLRALDLNAFLLDRAAAASLARVTSLRSLSLYFDSEGAGWEEVLSLMSLPELTRLILSYEGDAMTGPWVGDGPPADDDNPPPASSQTPRQHHHQQGNIDAGGSNGVPGNPHPNHQHEHHVLPDSAASGQQQQSHRQPHHGGPRSSAGSFPDRPRLPSWVQRPFSLQYLSLTTSPALHRMLGRLDALLPNVTYLSLSSVGEFGACQRELEVGLMAMAQAGSRLARIKLFCLELRPELMSCLTALPELQELMLFNVWVAVNDAAGARAGAAEAAHEAGGLAAVAAAAAAVAWAPGQAFMDEVLPQGMQVEAEGLPPQPPHEAQGQGPQAANAQGQAGGPAADPVVGTGLGYVGSGGGEQDAGADEQELRVAPNGGLQQPEQSLGEQREVEQQPEKESGSGLGGRDGVEMQIYAEVGHHSGAAGSSEAQGVGGQQLQGQVEQNPGSDMALGTEAAACPVPAAAVPDLRAPIDQQLNLAGQQDLIDHHTLQHLQDLQQDVQQGPGDPQQEADLADQVHEADVNQQQHVIGGAGGAAQAAGQGEPQGDANGIPAPGAGVVAGGIAVAGPGNEEAVAAGAAPMPESVLLWDALHATNVAQTHLEALGSLGGRLQQLLIEFGPEGSTCFITQGLVRTLEPLAPALQSLHLMSWNMDGLMLPSLEPLCFTAFTQLKSLTVANRISPDPQVNFAAPLPETTGHLIYLGELPRTLKSLCANRVNLCAGTPFEFPAAAAAAAATTTKTGPTGSTPMMTGGSGGHRKGTCSVATQTEGWMMPPLTWEDLAASDTPSDARTSGDGNIGLRSGSARGNGFGGDGSRLRGKVNNYAIAPSLLHMWLADCNFEGARPEEMAAALPALQTIVIRHVSKQEDLPLQLIKALHLLKDLTTLGLGGFNHQLMPHLWGLTQLRHLMLDPRRFEDVELDPDLMLDVIAPESDRSLALHESLMAMVAEGGLTRLRSLWLPDWAAPPHQLVQWQMQIAQMAPLVALRMVDHHYFWRLPAPVGCPEVQDRLQWWGFDAWNVL
ncbi:hypothetical protein VaNZ11_010794 [Volvox africanus]|uniref:F-box domain-containing protein n=1 Tax=Volvox africanus TaxID=51714 RepID=A0ABQ5SB42_9CHLO|nr:hypothetical protein VaNZ11_010794 [Volvox africanus]